MKISVNGGAWSSSRPPTSSTTPTTRRCSPRPAATPIRSPDSAAFTGTDGGAVDGTWGRSIIDLAGIAKANDKIRLRFDIGNDGCAGAFGWYVDDLKVYQCR